MTTRATDGGDLDGLFATRGANVPLLLGAGCAVSGINNSSPACHPSGALDNVIDVAPFAETADRAEKRRFPTADARLAAEVHQSVAPLVQVMFVLIGTLPTTKSTRTPHGMGSAVVPTSSTPSGMTIRCVNVNVVLRVRDTRSVPEFRCNQTSMRRRARQWRQQARSDAMTDPCVVEQIRWIRSRCDRC